MRLLELNEVSKHYADADHVVRAVDEITLTIEPGELCALYGPSGSGKTTLLFLAAALVAPDHGVVRFDGGDLADLTSAHLARYQRREVGFIYQTAQLLGGVPAVENAAIKLLADGVSLKHARHRASEWLERVGLGARQTHTPAQLSVGERQRVAIARALINEPRVVLADEPTANLDTPRGQEILQLLAGIAHDAGCAVLVATHDPQAAALADRICALRDGRLLVGEEALTSSAPPRTRFLAPEPS